MVFLREIAGHRLKSFLVGSDLLQIDHRHLKLPGQEFGDGGTLDDLFADQSIDQAAWRRCEIDTFIVAALHLIDNRLIDQSVLDQQVDNEIVPRVHNEKIMFRLRRSSIQRHKELRVGAGLAQPGDQHLHGFAGQHYLPYCFLFPLPAP